MQTYLFPAIDSSVKTLLAVVIGILLFFTILFNTWKLIKKSHFVDLMLTRTYSWWGIVIAYLLFFLIFPPAGHVGLFLLSAFGFREIIKNSNSLDVPKHLLWLCYFIIAFQFLTTAILHQISAVMIIPFLGTLLITVFCILFEPVETGVKVPPYLVWTMVLTTSGFAHLSLLYSLALKNAIPNAQGLFVYFLFLTQFNDVLQFIWGTIFGRVHISPIISPKKTWEGLIGAVFTTMAIAYFLRFITPFNGYQSLIVGFLLPIFGFWGDLTISMLKRNLKVKDMGTIIPGHGGILDRVDSIILSAFVYFYLVYFWFIV